MTLLVVGSAPCLYEDVEAALRLRPAATLMLVNGACTCIEHAEHILAGHTANAEAYAKARRTKFPHAHSWQLHASWHRLSEAPVDVYISVTKWWPGTVVTGSTSIAKGVRIGFALGFKEIILCGSPMDGSGYSTEEAQIKHEHGCHRVGDPAKQAHRVIARYRAKFKVLAQTEFKDRVFSASGYTRECLGFIEE